ncbi:single-stranded DNA-binding protein [Sedimenticola hydrogenitrophicus]|uniref:single-stranded DNA-binding protein n=1 Tax=Sedimenticola hydrogenitrophicus TaxID=2967975 RepID=UPI0023B11CCB|nr:single-stranded DNA-binding protein [Sedimenticola hydrogenitrophicus]
MSSLFSGTGNLGNVPDLKYFDVNGEKRPVADMRIFFDRRVKQEDGNYADGGGFWVTASIWGWRAEAAAKLLPKGARIFARGRLREETWEDDQNEQHTQLRLDADYLTVDLLCVDTLSVRTKADPPDDDAV